jgi:hypothetical protein
MARDEVPREDLLREATALVERIELAASSSSVSVAPSAANIVVGFRSQGAASFYFGDDPVYQFNAAGELRRAFCDGRLYKAARGRLVSLQRERAQGAVQLLSRELTDGEQRDLTTKMQRRLQTLAAELDRGAYSVVGWVPPEADVLSRVRRWLSVHDGMPIAKTPRV